jgi:hypothetical protein
MDISATMLNERNYRQWALEMENVLFRQGFWKFVTGEMRVPRPPIVPSTSSAASTTPKVARDPRDSDYNFEPESDDASYLTRFENFLRDWERWQMNNDKASGLINEFMEPTTKMRYREYKEPKALWEKIKADFEKVMKLDGQYELEKLASCKLEDHSSVREWISTQDAIIRDLAICDIIVEEKMKKFYILSNIPKSDDWRSFKISLQLSGKADTAADIITHLETFEVTLRRDKGIAPDSALFVSKKGRGRHPDTHWNKGFVCYGCGEKGHKKSDCSNRNKWASYANEKSKSETKVASAALTSAIDYESLLF